MLPISYLRPTTIQRLRVLLAEHGAQVPASSTAEEARDALAALLEARCDNPAFWDAIRALADDLRDDLRAGREIGLPTPSAELLSDREIQALVTELRAAMPDAIQVGAQPPRRAGMSAGATALATALAALWLAGCDRPPAAPLETPAAQTSANGTTSATTVVADAATDDGLERLFRDGSAEEIAAQLEAMVDGGVDAEACDAAAEAATAQRRTPRRQPPPEAVPMYKGISV